MRAHGSPSFVLTWLLAVCWHGLMAFPLQAAATSQPVESGGGDTPILEIGLSRDRVYPHEDVELLVTLLSSRTPPRNIRYPKFIAGRPPNLAGFSSPAVQTLRREDSEYTAHVFATRFRPTKAGTLELGPVEIRFDLRLPAEGALAFFGGVEEQPTVLVAERVRLEVLPIPAQGRPGNYAGAVGPFTLSRKAEPDTVRSGEPVMISTRQEGRGYPGTMACPGIRLPGVRAYPPRIRHSGQTLTCEQALLPQVTGILEIPPVSRSYFDPGAGLFRTVHAPTLRIRVLPGPAPVQGARAPAQRQETVVTAGSARSSWPWVAGGGAGIALVALLAWLRIARRGEVPQRPAGREGGRVPGLTYWMRQADRALADGDAAGMHTAAYRALQCLLGECLGVPPGGVTRAVLARVPPNSQWDDRLIQSCVQLLQRCDRVRYGAPGMSADDVMETHRALKEMEGAFRGCRNSLRPFSQEG